MRLTLCIKRAVPGYVWFLRIKEIKYLLMYHSDYKDENPLCFLNIHG